MAVDTKPPDVSEKSIVEALAEDVSLHGWKINSYTVKQDVEKEERTLSISLSKSTGAQQEVIPLEGGRRRRSSASRADGETGEG